MKSDEKSPPGDAGGPFDRSIRLELALAALLAGLLLAALLAALTARILLLLTGFLLRILLAALLTTLAALLPALIWIVRHWKRLLIAGRPRKNSTNRGSVGSAGVAGTRRRFETNVSQEPMRSRECK
jgi:hypothetical protein